MTEQGPKTAVVHKDNAVKTVWYGMGKAVEQLGPAAWEQRVQKVIEEKIIPNASPEWQAKLVKHKEMIAKTSGWIITGAEVGLVAAVTYKGVKLLKKKFGERHSHLAPQKTLSGETVVAANIPVMSETITNVDPVKWLSNVGAADQGDEVNLDWLKELSGEIASHPLSIDGLLVTKASPVPSNDVPAWLSTMSSLPREPHEYGQRMRKIINHIGPSPFKDSVAKYPPFLKQAKARRLAALASEKTAFTNDAVGSEKWWAHANALARNTAETIWLGAARQRARKARIGAKKAHEKAVFKERIAEGLRIVEEKIRQKELDLLNKPIFADEPSAWTTLLQHMHLRILKILHPEPKPSATLSNKPIFAPSKKK